MQIETLKGKQVQVYRNLHKDRYSVRCKKTKRVIAHVREIVLKDVKLKVSQAGRDRVLKEQKKNVHAFVEGEIVDYSVDWGVSSSLFVGIGWLHYNPYKYNCFVNDKGEKILQADKVHLYNHFSIRYSL
jgi:hypothetical protein